MLSRSGLALGMVRKWRPIDAAYRGKGRPRTQHRRSLFGPDGHRHRWSEHNGTRDARPNQDFKTGIRIGGGGVFGRRVRDWGLQRNFTAAQWEIIMHGQPNIANRLVGKHDTENPLFQELLAPVPVRHTLVLLQNATTKETAAVGWDEVESAAVQALMDGYGAVAARFAKVIDRDNGSVAAAFPASVVAAREADEAGSDMDGPEPGEGAAATTNNASSHVSRLLLVGRYAYAAIEVPAVFSAVHEELLRVDAGGGADESTISDEDSVEAELAQAALKVVNAAVGAARRAVENADANERRLLRQQEALSGNRDDDLSAKVASQADRSFHTLHHCDRFLYLVDSMGAENSLRVTAEPLNAAGFSEMIDEEGSSNGSDHFTGGASPPADDSGRENQKRRPAHKTPARTDSNSARDVMRWFWRNRDPTRPLDTDVAYFTWTSQQKNREGVSQTSTATAGSVRRASHVAHDIESIVIVPSEDPNKGLKAALKQRNIPHVGESFLDVMDEFTDYAHRTNLVAQRRPSPSSSSSSSSSGGAIASPSVTIASDLIAADLQAKGQRALRAPVVPAFAVQRRR